MTTSYHFLLTGEPLPFSGQATKRGMMNEYRERRLNLTQQLYNQFEDKQRINKPVSVEMAFGFVVPQHSKLSFDSLHTTQPPLLLLVEFTLLILREIVIQKDSFIVSFDAKKVYAPKPFTKIIVTEE